VRYEGLVDIDDTLLQMGPRQFTQPQLKAMRMAPDGVVVPATGRTRFRAQPLLEQLGAVEPAIVSYRPAVMVPGGGVPGEIMLLPQREVGLGLTYMVTRACCLPFLGVVWDGTYRVGSSLRLRDPAAILAPFTGTGGAEGLAGLEFSPPVDRQQVPC